MELPLVSVIVPCYNHGEYLKDAVASVAESTLSNVELVIVDDGSTDSATLEVLTELEASGYRILRQRNAGLSAARNAGVRATHGPFICCLDSDDVVDTTYLEKASWLLDRHPEIGFVTSFLENFDLNTFQWRPGRIHDLSAWWAENQAPYASVFRRSAWETVGGYDESLKGYEDWDFWLGALEQGFRPYQIPEPLIRYRVKAASMYTRVKADHHVMVEYIHSKHSALAGTLATRSARSFSAPGGGRRESGLARRFWRDATVLRSHGVASWAKWRAFPVARRIPGLLPTYRLLKRAAGTQSIPRLNGIIATAPPSLVVRPTSAKGVLFIVPWMEIGGADKVNLDLLRGLDGSAYHPVILTTLDSTHPWRSEFRKVTGDIFELTSLPSDPDERGAFIRHLIRTRNIQLVQVSNSQLGYDLLAHLVEDTSLPIVSLVHSSSPADPWDYVRTAASKDASISHHIVVSAQLQKELISLGVPESKITVISNGIDTMRYAPASSVWLKTLGIGNGALVVTWIGRLSAEKQPSLFIDAMQRVFLQFNSERCLGLVVGSGPLEDDVHRKLRDAGLVGKVYCLGQRSEPEIVEILRSTDVLVSTSRREGLPIVGLEAMACCVPIVATQVPGWTDLIISGINGQLCDPTPRALAQGIMDLLESDEKRRTMGQINRESVLRQYNLVDTVRRYEGIYSELLGSHASSDNSPFAVGACQKPFS